jgi:hypothetical protein
MSKHSVEAITGKPVRIPKALRDDLEAAIQAHLTAVEKLTTVLNTVDGDPDLEPSLGAPMGYGGDPSNQEVWASGSPHDTEEEHDGREPDVDEEPSLAHTNDVNQETARRHLTDLRFAGGAWGPGDADLEVEHDGREPEGMVRA